MRFRFRVRLFSSSCVKGFVWFVLCSAFHVSFSLASLSVDKKHSISLTVYLQLLLELKYQAHMVLVLWLKEHQSISNVFCSSDFTPKMETNTSTVESNNK